MSSLPITIATRKSPLALAQAKLVAVRLKAICGFDCVLLPLSTTGDRQLAWSLEKQGGKGLFTTELEEALRAGEADIAVHSTKDLPGEMSDDLVVAGYLPRADARDVLIVRAGVEQPARLATGSPRRRAQLGFLFPGVAFTEIRGNVETRLRKIAEEGLADGTVLAAAGLDRLGLASWPGLEFHALPANRMVPAVGQGAIAGQVRADDTERFAAAWDGATAEAVTVERAFQRALGSGCQTAFGCHAAVDSLFLFHEDAGLRNLPLDTADRQNPDATAQHVLKNLKLI